jgi:molybdate transport system substrate-binding protein
MQRAFAIIAAAALLAPAPSLATAAEVKILTAGAMKAVVLELVPAFEKETGHKAVVDNDTAGGLSKRILGGEAFDLVVVTPGVIDDLTGKGKVAAGTRAIVARVGVGVAVKDGAPLPDISSVDALKRTLLAAKSVAYIDPASGGSSGPFVVGLFEKLGIAAEMKPKAKLKNGGYVADLVASGEAEIGLHQISEIAPVKGARLVGPLPAEIQNYTTYAVGIAADAKQPDAAKAMIKLLSGSEAADVLKRRGMEKPPA